MTNEVTILIAEDDAGHARLIEKNLSRAGLSNPIMRFENGQQVIDFFFATDAAGRPKCDRNQSYLLLLDIRMPKVDGVEVLRRVKEDGKLRRLPVIMLTTTDDPREVEHCHALGCNSYIVKPVDYEKFTECIKNLGLFISLVEVPGLNSN
jgi:CheY-like chemotaxis protein